MIRLLVIAAAIGFPDNNPVGDIQASGGYCPGGVCNGSLDIADNDLTNIGDIAIDSVSPDATNLSITIGAGELGIGDGTYATDHSANVLVEGVFECDSRGWFDGGITIPDDAEIGFGDSDDAIITYDATNQDPDTLFIGVGQDSRQVIIAEAADIGTDLAIPQRSVPSLMLFSASGATNYVRFEHNGTDATIDTGNGGDVIVGTDLRMTDNKYLYLGSGYDFRLAHVTAQNPDSAMIGIGAESGQLILVDRLDMGTSVAAAQQSNPTLHIHSADENDANDYFMLAHDQSDVYMQTGRGGYKFQSSNGKGAMTQIQTKTESVTFANDASKVTVGSIIPSNAHVVGVTTRVSTAGAGCTAVDIGINGTDADCYADNSAVAAGTTTTMGEDGNLGDTCSAATDPSFGDQEITVTSAAGGNCTSGVWRITVHYLLTTADTAN